MIQRQVPRSQTRKSFSTTRRRGVVKWKNKQTGKTVWPFSQQTCAKQSERECEWENKRKNKKNHHNNNKRFFLLFLFSSLQRTDQHGTTCWMFLVLIVEKSEGSSRNFLVCCCCCFSLCPFCYPCCWLLKSCYACIKLAVHNGEDFPCHNYKKHFSLFVTREIFAKNSPGKSGFFPEIFPLFWKGDIWLVLKLL